MRAVVNELMSKRMLVKPSSRFDARTALSEPIQG
jgi:hypothetical protein